MIIVHNLKINFATFTLLSNYSRSCRALQQVKHNFKSKAAIIMSHISLSGQNKLKMPIVGIGTWRASSDEIKSVIDIALENGYRHIDTAFNYNNESAIGNALKCWFDEAKLKRDEIFITTKLPVFGNRPTDVEVFLKKSLNNLKLDYVDLYLIHMPFSFHRDGDEPAKNEDGSPKIDFNSNFLEIWKVLEEQVKKGLVKSIGLSNFNALQVKKVFDNAEIKPSVLQVEMHAYLQQKDLIKACKELNVAITAYAPLGSPGAGVHFQEKYGYPTREYPNLLQDPIIEELKKKYNKSSGQILLRFLAQQGIVVIPKSSNELRIKQNIDLFDFNIDQEDIRKIEAMDKGEKGRIFTFLFFKGIEKHPDYPFPSLYLI